MNFSLDWRGRAAEVVRMRISSNSTLKCIPFRILIIWFVWKYFWEKSKYSKSKKHKVRRNKFLNLFKRAKKWNRIELNKFAYRGCRVFFLLRENISQTAVKLKRVLVSLKLCSVCHRTIAAWVLQQKKIEFHFTASFREYFKIYSNK